MEGSVKHGSQNWNLFDVLGVWPSREPGRKHFDLSQVPGKAPPGMEWDPLRINDNDNLYQSAFGYHLLVPQTNNKLLWILAREVLKHSIFAMG